MDGPLAAQFVLFIHAARPLWGCREALTILTNLDVLLKQLQPTEGDLQCTLPTQGKP